MIAYSFAPKTHKFTGIKECQRDPLESQAQGRDVWLLPANSTFTEVISEKDGYDRIWNGTSWEYQEIPKEPEPEPAPELTTEEKNAVISAARASAYAHLIDSLHAEKTRKTVLGEWTDELETEYVAQVKALTKQIQDEHPYIVVDMDEESK